MNILFLKKKGSISSFPNFRKLVLTFRTISLWGQLLPPHHHPWEILKGSRCQNKLLFRERYCAFWKNIEDIEGKGSVAQIYFSIEKHFEQTKYWASKCFRDVLIAKYCYIFTIWWIMSSEAISPHIFLTWQWWWPAQVSWLRSHAIA